MTDEWIFRTVHGTATVGDGRLELSGSARRLVRENWRDGWTTNAAGRRALFVFSTAGTLWFFLRGIRSAPAVLSGNADLPSQFAVACVCFGLLAVAYRSTRTKTVELRDVRVVERVDDDELRVRFEDGARDSLDIETPTEDDADDATEILRLQGVTVEDATSAETPESEGFRDRLRAEAE